MPALHVLPPCHRFLRPCRPVSPSAARARVCLSLLQRTSRSSCLHGLGTLPMLTAHQLPRHHQPPQWRRRRKHAVVAHHVDVRRRYERSQASQPTGKQAEEKRPPMASTFGSAMAASARRPQRLRAMKRKSFGTCWGPCPRQKSCCRSERGGWTGQRCWRGCGPSISWSVRAALAGCGSSRRSRRRRSWRRFSRTLTCRQRFRSRPRPERRLGPRTSLTKPSSGLMTSSTSAS